MFNDRVAPDEGADMEEEEENELRDKIDLAMNLAEALKVVRTGRASANIFDHLEVTAYGEKHPFPDLCQVIVKGSNQLIVRVFDDAAKEDVIKAL